MQKTFLFLLLFFIPLQMNAQVEKQHLFDNPQHVGLPFEPKKPEIRKIQLTKKQENEFRCLSEAIYYEASNQSIRGKEAVAIVILNRKKDKNFPTNICKIVTQKIYNVCQFSYHCSFKRKIPNRDKSWEESKLVAFKAMNGDFNQNLKTKLDNALFFHEKKTRPLWKNKMIQVAKIEDHIFYSLK